MAAKAKKGSWLKKLMVFLNILSVLALVAAYAALFVDPRTFWPLAFAGLAYPVILAVNLFFVALWLVTWKKYILISLIPVLAGWTQIMTLVPVHFTKPGPAENGDLKVFTYNIHAFTYLSKDHFSTQQQISGFLVDEKPSVVCFQEFKPRGGTSVDSLGKILGLPSYYQKNYISYHDPDVIFGLVIYSRYPVVQTGFLKDDRNRVFAVWTDIRKGTETFRVYNCHLVSVRFGSKEYSFYEDLKNNETEKLDLKEGILNILKKLKKAFILRSEQTEKLMASLEQCPYPVVLAGDLNDSPFSYCFHRLTGSLNDSYREAGNGWIGNTFAGQLPSYRIDHILHSDDFHAVSYAKHKVEYSDHYPVSVILKKVR